MRVVAFWESGGRDKNKRKRGKRGKSGTTVRQKMKRSSKTMQNNIKKKNKIVLPRTCGPQPPLLLSHQLILLCMHIGRRIGNGRECERSVRNHGHSKHDPGRWWWWRQGATHQALNQHHVCHHQWNGQQCCKASAQERGEVEHRVRARSVATGAGDGEVVSSSAVSGRYKCTKEHGEHACVNTDPHGAGDRHAENSFRHDL